MVPIDLAARVYDEGRSTHSKRRRPHISRSGVTSGTLKRVMEYDDSGDELMDEDYRLYMNLLRGSGESLMSMGDEEDDSEEEDDTDPQYRIFLDNLKEDGKSYVLQVAINRERSVFMKYEEETTSDDEREPQTRKLRNASKDDGCEPQTRKFRNVSKNDESEPQTQKFRNASKDNEREPQTQILRQSSKDDEHEPQTRKLRSALKGEKIEAGKDVLAVLSKDRTESRNNLWHTKTIDKIETTKNKSNFQERERRNLVKEKGTKSAPAHLNFQELNGCTQERIQNVKSSSQLEGDHVREYRMIDECYEEFLRCIRQEGDSVVLVIEDGKRVKYEDDAESSDSEILATDHAPFCDDGNYNPFVPSRVFQSMEGDDLSCLGNPNQSNQTQYREKLMSILRRPYDQKEYEDLLQKVKEKKPVLGFRDLRNGIKSYSADTSSKSYLDHHNELKKKIDAARFDRRKVLNLLRGFFYWLQYLSNDGAFPPWLDSFCSEVMPGNR